MVEINFNAEDLLIKPDDSDQLTTADVGVLLQVAPCADCNEVELNIYSTGLSAREVVFFLFEALDTVLAELEEEEDEDGEND